MRRLQDGLIEVGTPPTSKKHSKCQFSPSSSSTSLEDLFTTKTSLLQLPRWTSMIPSGWLPSGIPSMPSQPRCLL